MIPSCLDVLVTLVYIPIAQVKNLQQIVMRHAMELYYFPTKFNKDSHWFSARQY